jgi:hypothetical protein
MQLHLWCAEQVVVVVHKRKTKTLREAYKGGGLRSGRPKCNVEKSDCIPGCVGGSGSVVQCEARTLCPLKVVDEAPHKVAAHVSAARDGIAHSSNVACGRQGDLAVMYVCEVVGCWCWGQGAAGCGTMLEAARAVKQTTSSPGRGGGVRCGAEQDTANDYGAHQRGAQTHTYKYSQHKRAHRPLRKSCLNVSFLAVATSGSATAQPFSVTYLTVTVLRIVSNASSNNSVLAAFLPSYESHAWYLYV